LIPTPSDDHWLLLTLGLAAMLVQLAFSFVTAAVIVMSTPLAGGALIAAVFVLAFILNVTQIFIHEMGHAVAAWSVGRRVHLICVGILGYAPDIGKFMHVKKPANAEYAGFVQASPVWPDLDNRKSIWISAGGPLATGGLGLLILAGAGLSGTFSVPLLLLAGFFIMDALVNLIPLQWTRGGGSDGLHILEYVRGHSWTADMWAEQRLATADLSPHLVSDEEWELLRPLRGNPFNSPAFNKLIDRAANQRGS
jgi:hypothetical protein